MISHTSNYLILSIIFTTLLCLSSSDDDIPNKYSSILGLNLDKLPNQDEALQLFQLWKKEYGRVYNDLEEVAKKYRSHEDCVNLNSAISDDDIPNKYSSILGLNLDKLPNQDEALQLFQLWKRVYGRVYNDLEEMAKKFEIFVSNLRIITEGNAKRKSPHDFLLGLTNFADWSSKEFKKRYLRDLDMPTDSDVMKLQDDVHLPRIPSPLHTVPQSVDWRSKGAVTNVKNQADCQSCWAFSAVGAIEGITKINTGKLINLSDQEVLDCDYMSMGCNGGYLYSAFDSVIRNKGIASEHDYAYNAQKGACRASRIPNSAIINRYYQVGQSDNELLHATANQPISVCLNVVSQDFQHYTAEIYDGRNCPVDSPYINHCMLIVGYGSAYGQDYWIVKNSWGTSWGSWGYMFIRRNTGKRYGVCAINAWAYYPVKNNGVSSNSTII